MALSENFLGSSGQQTPPLPESLRAFFQALNGTPMVNFEVHNETGYGTKNYRTDMPEGGSGYFTHAGVLAVIAQNPSTHQLDTYVTFYRPEIIELLEGAGFRRNERIVVPHVYNTEIFLNGRNSSYFQGIMDAMERADMEFGKRTVAEEQPQATPSAVPALTHK